MQLTRVRTATDFERTMGAGAMSLRKLVQTTPETDRDFRRVVDAIFADIELIDSEEPGMLRCFLDGVADPLDELYGMGYSVQHTRAHASYTMVGATDKVSVPLAVYFIAPEPCYFAWPHEEGGIGAIHVLGACPDATRRLALTEETGIHLLHSRMAIETFIPEEDRRWCPVCALVG